MTARFGTLFDAPIRLRFRRGWSRPRAASTSDGEFALYGPPATAPTIFPVRSSCLIAARGGLYRDRPDRAYGRVLAIVSTGSANMMK